MIPGSNILNMALSIIAPQNLTYFKFLGRTTNILGIDVPEYADPVTIQGSFQPIPARLYQQYGLDLSKSYFNLYVPKGVITTARDSSGDQVSFQDVKYQCESRTEWFGIDGWEAVICVLVEKQNVVLGFSKNNENLDNGDFNA